MLLELNISNFVLIDKLNIQFTNGFNVLTGETGAGKSIIIGAISLILGGRGNKDSIKYGENKATIEALFNIYSHEHIRNKLNDFGIELEEDDSLLITREIFNNGRSICRINGRVVTLNMLRSIGHNFINIHGQHEHQTLLNSDYHINIIDSLATDNVLNIKQEIQKYYTDFINLKSKLNKFNLSSMEMERTIDLLKFQIEEISDSNLKIDEEELLFKEYKTLSNTDDIIKNLDEIRSKTLNSDFNQIGVIDGIQNLQRLLQNILNYDNNISPLYEIVENIHYQLQDLSTELRIYSDKIEFDPHRLTFIEERLDLINRLKRKYGKTIKEILEYKDKKETELKLIQNKDKEIQKINKNLEHLENQLKILCEELSVKRKKICTQLELDIAKELSELNMKNIQFVVQFDKYDYFTNNGIDKIEFLISTNIGQPLKPLSKIVSGGEMSRIMLALKTILADIDKIPTLIFDEIDTGISGKTATIVGEKIVDISKNHQILCITHLPQIAVMSDGHFLIEKIIESYEARTCVKKLSSTEKINEIARLQGSLNLTETSIKHAEEILDNAKKYKLQN